MSVDLQGLAIERSDAEQPKVRRKHHWLTRYVLPLLLIAGFLSLIAWAGRDIVFPARPVTVMPVIAGSAEVQQEGTPLFQAAGWIEPRPTTIRVAALAPGVVDQLLVVEDQHVEAGQPVAELVKDDARLSHQFALADLELRLAEQQRAAALHKAAETRFHQPVHLEAALREAEALLAKTNTELQNLPFAIVRAEADAQAAQKQYEAKAASVDVVPQVKIEVAHSVAAAAQAQAEELRQRLPSLQKEQAALSARCQALQTQLELLAEETRERDSAAAQLAAAKAKVEQARVAVAEAKLRLDRMTIRAPVDGRIYHLVGLPGARVGMGANPFAGSDGSSVVTMYQPNMLQVRVDVRFEDIPKVSLHQPVKINNDALPRPIDGSVLFISSEADIQKNTLQVKVAITDPPAVLKPEMLMDVTFLAPEQPERQEEPNYEMKLYIPRQLALESEAGSFVWTVDQSEGVAKRTAVQLGTVAAGGLVQVNKGLTVTSRLIVGGAEGLRPGSRVRITGEDHSMQPAGHLTTHGRQPESPGE